MHSSSRRWVEYVYIEAHQRLVLAVLIQREWAAIDRFEASSTGCQSPNGTNRSNTPTSTISFLIAQHLPVATTPRHCASWVCGEQIAPGGGKTMLFLPLEGCQALQRIRCRSIPVWGRYHVEVVRFSFAGGSAPPPAPSAANSLGSSMETVSKATKTATRIWHVPCAWSAALIPRVTHRQLVASSMEQDRCVLPVHCSVRRSEPDAAPNA